MNYRQLYEEGRRRLKTAGISDAALDARILLEETCHTNLQTMLTDPERAVTEDEEASYRAFISRRENREPTAMILGKWDFCGLTFALNEETLIPEQDTERLVEVALERQKEITVESGEDASAAEGGARSAAEEDGRHPASLEEPPKSLRILDLCTGSGCILLSLLHFMPEACGLGTDISARALEAAKENAAALGLDGRACFARGDMWEPAGTERFDLIVSNPPYIPTDVIPSLEPEVRCGEPYAALDGGADGLDFYRMIAAKAAEHLKPGGLLVLESGFDEAGAICGLLAEQGFEAIRTDQDYGGLDRVVSARRP